MATGSGPALSVELSAYVLLSLVKLGGSEDLVHGRSIVRWLSKQRNSDGGFVSTQDTVVALQVVQCVDQIDGRQKRLTVPLLIDRPLLRTRR